MFPSLKSKTITFTMWAKKWTLKSPLLPIYILETFSIILEKTINVMTLKRVAGRGFIVKLPR